MERGFGGYAAVRVAQFVDEETEEVLFLLRLFLEECGDKRHGLGADVGEGVEGEGLRGVC